MGELSPMMRQYMEIKGRHPDSILFFRLGDFYEMFFEDAETVSGELDLVLTGKECGLEKRAPMCGVPYHSCEGYIARLVEKGYKIAICEQTEDPAKAKGLVKRDVVKIITPGTVLEGSMLEESRNNYLCAISTGINGFGVCFSDASTGELYLTQINGENIERRLINEIGRFSPSEVICDKNFKSKSAAVKFITDRLGIMLTVREEKCFTESNTEAAIHSHFNVSTVEELSITPESLAHKAFCAVIDYFTETAVSGNISVNTINIYTEEEYMKLDINTIRNLELVETMRQKSKRGSLLWVMDKTKTAMGKRLMRSWIEKPLMNIADIRSRQDAVEELVGDAVVRGELTNALMGVRDIERLATKTVYGSANARDLNQICKTLESFPAVKEQLSKMKSRLLCQLNEEIDPLEDIAHLIENAIRDDAPNVLKEGGMIKKGYNSELDELRLILEQGKDFIINIEASEREKTGIKNLRIRYNRVFGYYIEVTNSFLDKVPENYIRKQTLTNCERFITDELKQLEYKVLGASERINSLEYELFCDIRRRTADRIIDFQTSACAISKVDALCSMATVAVEGNYCRPEVNDSGEIKILGGRHPVVEKVIDTPFVSNDTNLNMTNERCAVITGPNMAGKSTYMRQAAIITVMAQMGAFVPAASAVIGVVDAVFTRVGASDDLASGQSTFMIEMNEVSDIVRNATRNSLLILDEIGRGTSTFDGMAIARAVLEHVASTDKLGAKTLFATHYHELTMMESEFDGIKNYNIAVKKRGDDIIFLRRIVSGGADDSYGIEVAKLSGIPDSIISRAKVILKELVSDGIQVVRNTNTALEEPVSDGANIIYDKLRSIDVDTLTPIEAMKILYELCGEAKSL